MRPNFSERRLCPVSRFEGFIGLSKKNYAMDMHTEE
jgi:hypothetical protein